MVNYAIKWRAAAQVAALAAGDAHSAALTANGFLFTWGSNDRGQLGLPALAEVAAQARHPILKPLFKLFSSNLKSHFAT